MLEEVRLAHDLLQLSYEGRPVRLRLIEGQPWWVLRDVTAAIGIERGARVTDRLDPDDVRQAYIIDNLGRRQETTLVNEAGLYSIILRSDKLEAVPFRRWVTAEVLPTIRRQGFYCAVPGMPDFSNPAAAARAWADEFEKREQAFALVAELEPRAAAADRIACAGGLRTLTEIGKINGIGPRRIFEVLADRGIIFRSRGIWLPYQEHIEAGRFVVRETTYRDADDNEKLTSQTYVTGKGEVWLAKQLFPPSGAGLPSSLAQ